MNQAVVVAMRVTAPWCLAICLVLAAGLARAAQPLITDDTGTQGAGGHQIEGGIARSSDKRAGGTDATRELVLGYSYGVTDTLDVFVGLPHQRLAPAGGASTSGWSNPSIGAKWRFFEDEGSKLSFALRPELQSPVSTAKEARGLGQAKSSWRLDLLMTLETGFGALHANLATTRVNFNDAALNAASRRNQYRLSVAPVWDVAEQWKLALDLGLMTNPDRTAKARMGYVELGAIYSPSKNLDFALGVIRNVSDGPVTSTQWTAGVTWRFE